MLMRLKWFLSRKNDCSCYLLAELRPFEYLLDYFCASQYSLNLNMDI